MHKKPRLWHYGILNTKLFIGHPSLAQTVKNNKFLISFSEYLITVVITAPYPYIYWWKVQRRNFSNKNIVSSVWTKFKNITYLLFSFFSFFLIFERKSRTRQNDLILKRLNISALLIVLWLRRPNNNSYNNNFDNNNDVSGF